jgi:hypothetical protein
MQTVNKVAISVSEMARKLSMSRARFYQLMNNGVFPKPLIEVSTSRPYFDEQLQETCLNVRRRNCGVNGRPVMFYPTRQASPTSLKRSVKSKPDTTEKHTELIESLSCLGLAVNGPKIEAAITECYPTGISDTDQGNVVRKLFLHLQRQN